MSKTNVFPTRIGTNFQALFLAGTPLIDVRAPTEFVQGHLPGATNLPLLNDYERAAVGTMYKASGQEAAIRLGHSLVTGDSKESRIRSWMDFKHVHPNAVIYCFRGGLRSQITKEWLQRRGLEIDLVVGGYKAGRNFFLNELERLCQTQRFLAITGPTGSGKTRLLQEARAINPIVDLEAIALHRGSAFGSLDIAQPSQINFENLLSLALMKASTQSASEQTILIEDESRMIGRCTLPLNLFSRLQSAKSIQIEEPIEVRVQTLFQLYIKESPIGKSLGFCPEPQSLELSQQGALATFQKYKNSVMAISKRLGGSRTKEILALLDEAEYAYLADRSLDRNRIWIEKILTWYYDPLYKSGLERRKKSVLFKGSHRECLDYLRAGAGFTSVAK